MKKVLIITSAILLLAAACNKQVSVQPASAPIPTSIADQTTNWKTYTNSQYGFEFKYPSSWQVDESVQKSTVFGDLPTIKVTDTMNSAAVEGSNINPFWEVTYTKDTFGTIDKYMSKYIQIIQALPKSVTKEIDSHTTYHVEGPTPPGVQDFYVVFTNGYVFNLLGPKALFWAGNDTQKIVTQILPTFKFTK